MPVETRELRYFAEVVDSGSIGRAATRLGVSQPALTKCIRQLEQRLKVHLLERGPRGVKPTVFGHSLWLHAKSITAEIARAQAEIADLNRSSGSILSVGILPSMTGHIMPEAVLRLSRASTHLRIRVIERPAADLLSAIVRGEFDLVLSVVDPEALPPNISASVLIRDRPSLIVRTGHPLVGPRTVPWSEIRQYPWVLPPPGSRRRGKLEALISRATTGGAPDQIIECHSTAFLKAVVMRSDYVGMLANDWPHLEEQQGLLTRIKAIEQPSDRSIGFMYRNEHPMTQAARSLMREVRRVCAEREDALRAEPDGAHDPTGRL
jgi:DNA-binding transcriptional LysR family regulator